MERTALVNWRLRHVDGPRPGDPIDLAATVPGVVHVDLEAAGLIDDPYLDRHEDDQHWVGESDWEYATTLRVDRRPHERVDLVFDGLDTIATVSIDGSDVLATENMHRRYRADIAQWADGESHDLVVRFTSPSSWATTRAAELGDLPNPYDQPYNVIRKMAANFGWDWGPRLTTSGIWKPVATERWHHARLAAVRPSVEVTADGTGLLTVAVEVEWDHGADPIEVRVVVGPPQASGVTTASTTQHNVQTLMPGTTELTVRVDVADVHRWWPRGRGAPVLYPLHVELASGDQILDYRQMRVGFRTVSIDTAPDEDGSRWAIVVNGERVWVRGVNWIPDDCFPSRVDRSRYANRIGQAVEANVNLLRVWGGGIYESDDFYDLCDELGVLVWQDFLFACAAYPEAELLEEVRAEAVDAIDRLMSHPSLVLWNGNNENHWGWWDWGWQERLGDRPWGLGFYEELLPALVAERDPGRPYLRGSPSSGDDPNRHPNDPAHGPIHIWDVWNDLDYTEYRGYQPRFVSEFGFQAPPTCATLERAVSTRPLAIDDPALLHHQKAFDGHTKLSRALVHHFGPCDEFDRWHYLTQLNQARAIQVGVGHLRRLHERCAGAVWWQLNDCWPAVSWSVVDGDGHKKLGWYALRQAFDDRLVVVEPNDSGAIVAALVNDRREPWTTELVCERVDTMGAIRARWVHEVEVAPDSVVELAIPERCARPDDPAGELMRVRAAERSAWWTWVPDRQLRLPAADLWWDLRPTADGSIVTVSSTTVVRDLCVLVDRIDPAADCDSQMVTLLPGEEHIFTISGVDAEQAAAGVADALFAVNLSR